MPSIGAHTVDTLAGTLIPAGGRLEAIDRPGRDYVDYRLDGASSTPATIRTQTLLGPSAAPAQTTAENLATAVAAALALQGTLQTITDDWGTAHLLCTILDVRPSARAVLDAGVVKALLETTWTVQRGPQ